MNSTLRQSLRSYTERCGSASAGRQRVVLPVLLVLSFGSIPRWTADGLAHLPTVISGVALAGFSAWLVFTLFSLIFRFIFPNQSIRRGVAFVLLYGLIESVRAVVLAAYFIQVGLSAGANWPFEVVGGYLTGVALYATMSLFIGDAEIYKNDLAALLEARERLRLVLESIEKDLRERREELLVSVREVISGALASVIKQRGRKPGADARLVSELNRISADVVRPLSHSMYGQDGLGLALSNSLIIPKVRFNRVAVLTSIVSPFRPAATATLIFMLIAPASILRLGSVQGIYAMVSVIGVTVVWLAVCKYVLLRWIAKLPFALRAVLILALYAGLAVFVLAVVIKGENLEVPVSLETQALYGVLLGVPLLTVLAITPATRQARDEVIAETATTNHELSWMTARLGAELWADRRAIAKSLHQDVQGVLVAAAFRLQQAIDRGEDTDVAAEEVFGIVQLAANFAVAPQEPPSMEHALGVLRERWEGILEIAYEADSKAERALGADRIARQLMQETISEFAINSVKHGLASRADVKIAFASQRVLSVVLTNNGGPIAESATFDGLGFGMMLTMGINGTYENLPDGGVALRASIPVDSRTSVAKTS